MLGRPSTGVGGTRTRMQALSAGGLALSCSRAFLEYYQEHLEYACPTEDIYLE